MTTTIGWILAGLNVLLTILLATIRNADEKNECLKDVIREELKMAYNESFDHDMQTEAEWRNIGASSDRSSRLARLHFSLLNDYSTIYRTGNLIRHGLRIAIMLLILSVASAVSAAIFITPLVPKRIAAEIIFSIVIPFLGFVIQLSLLGALELKARTARELTGRYTRKEY
jgi:hypothetical protein